MEKSRRLVKDYIMHDITRNRVHFCSLRLLCLSHQSLTLAVVLQVFK